MAQLLKGLQYLHDVAGVVHGDIKRTYHLADHALMAWDVYLRVLFSDMCGAAIADECSTMFCASLSSLLSLLTSNVLLLVCCAASNIIREGGTLKFTNLGTAVKHRDRELVSAELQQLAYAAPELAQLQRDCDMLRGTAEPGVNNTSSVDSATGLGTEQDGGKHSANQEAQLKNRAYSHAPNDAAEMTLVNDLFPVPNKPGERILGAPNQDMWSIGCIFYLLLTGESLFLNDVAEDIDSDQVDILTEWPEFVKQRRLEKVADVSARCLLSQLLSRHPAQRPSAQYCLQHPFVANTLPLVRYVGVSPSFEVYLCHRRDKVVPIPAVQEFVSAAEEAPAQGEGAKPADVNTKDKNISAMQRMFGASFSGSDALDDDSQSLEDGSLSLAGDSLQEGSVKADVATHQEGQHKGPVDDITTPAGRAEMLRQYFNELGTTASDTLHCPVTVPQPFSTVAAATALDCSEESQRLLSAAERIARGAAQWGREVALSKCGAAVILLSKETWKALEDRCAELMQAHKTALAAARGGAVSVRANKATAPGAVKKVEKSEEEQARAAEQLQLLDDFLYEVRLILELQSMGLFENGVFVIAAGEPQPAQTGNQAGEGVSEGRVLSEYFQRYMGDMVGRFGGSHPGASAPNFVVPELEGRLAECLSVFGYGVASCHPNLTLNELFRYLVRLPTFHAIGPEREAFRASVEGISALIFRTARMGRAVASRPNTGAFNMHHAARIASPQLVSVSGEGRSRSNSALKKSSFTLTGAGNGSFSAHSMAGITSGISAGVYPMGCSVSWDAHSSSRSLLRTSSGRKNPGRAITPLAPLSHSRPVSSDHSLRQNALAAANAAQGAPRSPVSGLRVRAYTPSKSPRHLGYADTTAQQSQQVRAHSATGRSSASPQHSPARPYSSAHDLFEGTGYPATGTGAIPIRPWSGVDPSFSHLRSFRNTTNFGTSSGEEGEDFTHENEVAFYNNEDIVTVPYFTEIVGEDRVRTANAMSYMSNKLEASENQIANLEDELALLRAQLANRDVELTHLRTVVASNAVQSPAIPRKKLK
jgi:serine/threonine protein kinase